MVTPRRETVRLRNAPLVRWIFSSRMRNHSTSPVAHTCVRRPTLRRNFVTTTSDLRQCARAKYPGSIRRAPTDSIRSTVPVPPTPIDRSDSRASRSRNVSRIRSTPTSIPRPFGETISSECQLGSSREGVVRCRLRSRRGLVVSVNSTAFRTCRSRGCSRRKVAGGIFELREDRSLHSRSPLVQITIVRYLPLASLLAAKT